MHPEMVLDEDSAIKLFDKTKTVVADMLRDIRSNGSHFKVEWSEYDFSWAWN
jgi:hypothetical protein